MNLIFVYKKKIQEREMREERKTKLKMDKGKKTWWKKKKPAIASFNHFETIVIQKMN